MMRLRMHHLLPLLTLCCLTLSLGFASPLAAQDSWGTLKGRFVYEGDIPEAAPLVITSDQEYCTPFNLTSESLVVNAENRGIANIVVSLYVPSTGTDPAIHPDYAESADAEILFNNNQCRFSPHVCAIRTSQTLVIGNLDTVAHNSAITPISNPPANYTVLPGQTVNHQFGAAERFPTKISCGMHPWMFSYVVVTDHPYIAITDEDGYFEIVNLPVGERTIANWHESAGYISEVDLGNGPEPWARGKYTHAVVEGDNDLGEIKVDASLFERN